MRDILQEAEAVIVVDDICSSEFEYVRMTGIHLFRSCRIDFRVLNHIRLAIPLEDETNRLLSIALSDDLGGDVDIFARGKADEGWISHFYQAIVDAVGMDMLDSSLAHVLDN